MDDIIKKYEESGYLIGLINKEDKRIVVSMFEDINKEFYYNLEINRSYNFCGIIAEFINSAYDVISTFYKKYGHINHIRVIYDFHQFLILCELGFFNNIIMPDNQEKIFIYLFIGYSMKQDWFFNEKINNMKINLN